MMKMKHDAIDRLLQLAYLEGAVTTHGLYEKTVAKRNVRTSVTDESRSALLAALEDALQQKREQLQVPRTVGDFLSALRENEGLASSELSARLGLRPNVYRMLEHDRISPLRIPVDVWRKFVCLFHIERATFDEMVRRTLRLVLFRPSFASTLARYKRGKKAGGKRATLRAAAEELYRRSDLRLPPREERELSDLLEQVWDTQHPG
jgi:transcriptional regulator with XRE-family HTH domain